MNNDKEYKMREVKMARLTTEQSLMIIHGGITVPLSDISEKYLGLSPTNAAKRAKARMESDKRVPHLELPAFKIGNTNKSPWHVKVTDLAELIDERHEESVSVSP